MESPDLLHPRPGASLSRRTILRSTALGAATVSAASVIGAQAQEPPGKPAPDDRRSSPKRYDKMKKSINQWAFPYPERMNLRECLQLAKDAGFDGIELNYDLENDLSPKSGTKEYHAIRKMADDIGIAISGLCSFLFWPYPLTSNDKSKRSKGLELAENIHLKEFTKKGTDHSLECFRPLLDGTTNWPAVIGELDKVGYEGYLTFEYFHPYPHYPEALIYQTSDSLDRLLGRI